MNKETRSRYAYLFCKEAKENHNLRNLEKKNEITDSMWAYNYCRTIDDDESVRKNITDPIHINLYLKYINPNNEEMKRRLNEHVESVIYL